MDEPPPRGMQDIPFILKRDILQMADEIERLRSAMIFIMQDVDGFAGVSRDRYDFASQVADERGITGGIPVECELEGFLRMIEQAKTGGNDENRESCAK